MNREEPNQDEAAGPQAPAGLVDALGALHKERVFVPPAVDRAVLDHARPRLAFARQRRAQLHRAQWTALAAAVVLGFFVLQALWPRSPEDLNRDGRVDILDAFQLAREIKAGKGLEQHDDVNGDGRIDAADVEYLARRAVRLDKGGRS